MTRTLAGLALAILCAACVTENYVTLRPDAGKVKAVRETNRPLRCTTIGEVHGISRSQDEARAREGAQNDIRNEAARFKGANFVLIEIDRVKPVGTSPYREIFLGGKALKCEEGGS